VSENEQIQQQAAQWVAREDRGLAADESAALSAWLDECTSNRLAYLRLKTSWEGSARLAALQNSPHFRDRSALRLMGTRAAATLVAIFVTAAIGGGVFYYNSLQGQRVVYSTQIGQRPTLRLSDGTRIQLNTNTSVQANITRAMRTVTLEKGEAYFDVVHDASRPFVVLAGNRKITDLGTKFSVRRDGDKVYVVVKEGRVRVDSVGASPMPAMPIYADGGNVIVAKADEMLVAPKSAQDMSDDLSWRSGMLVFNQKTLADAAEEFNRYNRKQIVVDGAARDIRIGGSFKADNIEVFALLVRNALGLRVTDENDQILISK
jgi:transmembrane sensor